MCVTLTIVNFKAHGIYLNVIYLNETKFRQIPLNGFDENSKVFTKLYTKAKEPFVTIILFHFRCFLRNVNF